MRRSPKIHSAPRVSRRLVLGAWVCAAVPAICGEPLSKAPIVQVPVELPERRSHFRISAGWAYRDVGRVDFRSSAQTKVSQLPDFLGPGYRREPAVGPVDALSDRRYVDGSVRLDDGTLEVGATSAWAYANSSQVVGDFLEFHASGSQREIDGNTTDTPSGAWSIDGSGGAPVVGVDWWYDLDPVFSVGLQSFWTFLGFDGGGRDSTVAATQQASSSHLDVVDRYALYGIIPPAAPYEGSGDGFGPLLDAIPASRLISESPTGSETVRLFNSIEESLDVSLHTFSLGAVTHARWKSLTASVSGGPAVSIAEWDATHVETLWVVRNDRPWSEYKKWRSQQGRTDVLLGLYVQGSVSLRIGSRLSLSAFGRYDWCDDLEGSVGASRFSVDLAGWTTGALIGIDF